MGCCVSTTNSLPPPPKTAAKSISITKSPPPPPNPLPEEETVKEVLSETPTIPKHSPPTIVPRTHHHHENRRNESPFIKTAPLLLEKIKHQNGGGACRKPSSALSGDDLSEASEICSTLSESVSVSTTVTTEKRENEELREFRQRSPARFKNRSFSGEAKREKTVGRSPGRRSEPSPGRVRNGPGPGSGYGRRKDSGESSGRRSRSPVTRVEAAQSKACLGRSPSARKTGKSPGRAGSGLGERIRKVDDHPGSKWPPTSDESLENPLVSLECFIFL